MASLLPERVARRNWSVFSSLRFLSLFILSLSSLFSLLFSSFFFFFGRRVRHDVSPSKWADGCHRGRLTYEIFLFPFFFSLCFRWSFFHFPPSHRAPKNRKKFKKYGVAHRHPNRVRWTQKEPEKKKKTIKKEPGRKSDDGVSRCGPTIKKKNPQKKAETKWKNRQHWPNRVT